MKLKVYYPANTDKKEHGKNMVDRNPVANYRDMLRNRILGNDTTRRRVG